ncbi:type II secretion system protein N [Acidovorax lacteus]|uniref:Type II secretion system protein N n=1 Tax=Acidovorax lacteus TaxID=1924988 RepID=A0ABP8L0H6_9BURK
MLRRTASPPLSRRPAPPRADAARVRAPWAWAALGLAMGALPALLVFAPAQWLASSLRQATNGQVQLLQARGTVWNGHAQLLLTGGAGSRDQAALPGSIGWQLRPALTGLRLSITADCCTPAPLQASVRAGWRSAQVQIDDHTSQWPAALLAGLGTPWNTLQPQGQLVLQTEGLALQWAAGRAVLQGQARVDARAMSSRLSTLRPMGSYRLQVQGGELPSLTLATLEGDLLLSGSGQWVGQRLRFAGEARAARPEREGALANLLNIIGRRQGERSIITVG